MIEKNTIHHADCLEFLPQIPRQSVDLAVIDPPYNLKKASWDNFGSHDQFLAFTHKWIDELLPTLKESGSIYVFNTPLNCAFIATYLLSKHLHYRNWITWDKRDGFVGGTRRFAPMQESIVYFSMSPQPYFDADSVRTPYLSTERIEHARKKGILKDGKRWFPNEKGKLCTDVWHIASERHKNKIGGRVMKAAHGTPKPVELIQRIILASSQPGDLVLDCFSGSGTTAYAARKLGRDFYACEREATFVAQSQTRLLTL